MSVSIERVAALTCIEELGMEHPAYQRDLAGS